VKLADLQYRIGSHRQDDLGALYVAPVCEAKFDVSLGALALYATTNGDPIWLGWITDGALELTEPTSTLPGMDGDMAAVLSRAGWNHNKTGEGYSYLVEEAVEMWMGRNT
jgi:hypothetical protein